MTIHVATWWDINISWVTGSQWCVAMKHFRLSREVSLVRNMAAKSLDFTVTQETENEQKTPSLRGLSRSEWGKQNGPMARAMNKANRKLFFLGIPTHYVITHTCPTLIGGAWLRA